MQLDIVGHWVTRVSFENGVLLETLEGARLRLEGTFSVTPSRGPATLIEDPCRVGQGAVTILRLLHATVREAEAGDDGSLSILFENGERLEVGPDPAYEAWEIDLPGSPSKIVCMPGGKLAIWD